MERDLITAYLTELRRALAWRADLDDVCAEVEDHLREKADRLAATGVEPGEAQRRTLECFGDLGAVARAFALAPSGALAVPTAFTRASGQVAVAAGLAWMLPAVWVWFADTSLILSGWSTLRYLIFAGVAMIAAGLTVVALGGLSARARGVRSRGTVAVFVLSGTGALVTGALTWMWALTTLLLTVASVIAVLGVRSLGLDHRGLTAALLAAWPIGAGLLYALNERWPIGQVDQYGDYPLAWAVSFSVAASLFGVGLVGYGRRLAAEVPAELPVSSSGGALGQRV